MVKKHFIVMTRYPVSFITSFGMVFIFMLLFIFAISMFVPAHGEWENAEVLSESPFIAVQNDSGLCLALRSDNISSSAYLSLYPANITIYPDGTLNGTAEIDYTYDNSTWVLEMRVNATNISGITLFTGAENLSWNISASSLPFGDVIIDGKIEDGRGNNISGIAFYGFIFFMFLQDIIWMIGYSLREEQYQGTLESLYLTPVNHFSNLVSRAFINVFWTGLNVIVALLFVSYIFGALPAGNIVFALMVLFLALLQMFGMGFIFAAFTLRAKGSADFIMNFIGIVFTFTCAMFFPFSTLPKAMVDYLSRWIPLSYAVDLFRSALLSYPEGFPELLPASTELYITVAWAILLPIIGYFLYWKIERSARMKGTLSEY